MISGYQKDIRIALCRKDGISLLIFERSEKGFTNDLGVNRIYPTITKKRVDSFLNACFETNLKGCIRYVYNFA